MNKLRHISPERLADWLVRNQLKFANELYNVLNAKCDDPVAFWKQPIIQKYVALEDKLRDHRILVEPVGPVYIARGLAINVDHVRSYLCDTFDVPF